MAAYESITAGNESSWVRCADGFAAGSIKNASGDLVAYYEVNTDDEPSDVNADRDRDAVNADGPDVLDHRVPCSYRLAVVTGSCDVRILPRRRIT